MKVLLILVDGMRPDSFTDIAKAQEIVKKGASDMSATAVMPSMTLPCHMSLFHSVDPDRHGTTTNTYAPQVRPIRGLTDVLTASGKRCAFYFDWHELRDLAKPGTLAVSSFYRGYLLGFEKTDAILTEEVIAELRGNNFDLDFIFLYLGAPDIAGHDHGWMSEPYMESVRTAWDRVERVLAAVPEDYTVIITADHGGHDRTHGTEMPEDMTIPMIFIGRDFQPGSKLENANIKDIAPTVAKLLDAASDRDWDGKSLL